MTYTPDVLQEHLTELSLDSPEIVESIEAHPFEFITDMEILQQTKRDQQSKEDLAAIQRVRECI